MYGWRMNISNHIAQVSFQLARRIDHELWATYVPTSLLLGICYGTLFIPLENFSDRGTISLTTMLVLISLYTDSQSNLPATSYNKHIDLWYLFIIFYMSLIIAVHLATSQTTSVQKVQSRNKIQPVFGNCSPRVHGTNACINCAKVLKGSRLLFAVALIAFLIFYLWPDFSEKERDLPNQCRYM